VTQTQLALDVPANEPPAPAPRASGASSEHAWPEKPEYVPMKGGKGLWHTRVLVQSDAQLAAMEAALTDELRISYDTESSGLKPSLGARVCGHAFAYYAAADHVVSFYVPVRHIGPTNDGATQLDPARAAEAVGRILADPSKIVETHHGKHERSMLRADGQRIRRRVRDVAILATVANENEPGFGLKKLGPKYVLAREAEEKDEMDAWMKVDARRLGLKFKKTETIDIEEVDELAEPTYLERFGYARAPINLCGVYACMDVFLTLTLGTITYANIEEQYPLVTAREHRVGDILHNMEWLGLPADSAEISRAHEVTGAEVLHWLNRVRELADWPEFENTQPQMGELLYSRLGLVPQKVSKKTKKPSTDLSARRLLAKKYPQHRGLIYALNKLQAAVKLHSTYSGNFLKFFSPTTRAIHPSYNQMERKAEGGVPVTGRLNSSEPNIQNIASQPLHLRECECKECRKERDLAGVMLSPLPEGLEEGPKKTISIRRYFKTRPGFIRIYIDFSQIELRVLAWFCRDPELLRAYANDIDVHQVVADRLGISRKVAKQVNFGNSYGMTEKGLALRLPGYYDDPAATEEFAKKTLEAYFKEFASILSFRREFADQCRRNGCSFVNPFGRPRRIPQLNSYQRWERERGERMMMSSIISGTAADIMKESMIRCDDILQSGEGPHGHGYLVQTIHDELVFDLVDRPGWARVLVRIIRAMENWPMFEKGGVPIKTSCDIVRLGDDKTWADKEGLKLLDDDSFEFAHAA
jgi:DNA polymerase I-like protein with 3'-5' exonuclease and polymerase domains